MAKLKAPQREAMSHTSLRVPARMLTNMEEKMKEGGYNKKQRSIWIAEAIQALLANPDHGNLIAEEFISAGSNKQIPVSLPEKLARRIDRTIEIVNERENINKDKSALIRTAIIQRMIHRIKFKGVSQGDS